MSKTTSTILLIVVSLFLAGTLAYVAFLPKSSGDGIAKPGQGVVIDVPSVGTSFKCPNDYPSVQAYVDGTAKLAGAYRATHPAATDQEVLAYGAQLMQEHHCAVSKWLGL